MNKIHLIIPGAGRSGTTTLYSYLERHKDICFSKIKEVHYFSVPELYERGTEYYHSFWENNDGKKINVAADTYLFIDKKAPERIAKYNPKMKFIIMLREPVSRAFSGYNYAINNGYLKKDISFIQSIKNENNLLKSDVGIEVQNNLCNAHQSLYYTNLKYWLKYFPIENFLFLKTNELKDILVFLKKVSNFLNISEFENIDTGIKANKASAVKSKKIQQLLLNRNTVLRIILRKIISQTIKNKIINSGLVDKLYKINKSGKQLSKLKISKDEQEFAQKYFIEDLELIKKEFNIKF